MTVRRTRADLDRLMRQLGTDLGLAHRGPAGYWEDADLQITTRPGAALGAIDVAVARELDAADQMLINRLKTTKGELAPLGHPEYGSRHHEQIGEPNVERTRNLIKRDVIEALGHEPRISEVLDVRVFAGHQPPRDVVRIEVDVQLIGEPTPRNLVVPFSLALEAP